MRIHPRALPRFWQNVVNRRYVSATDPDASVVRKGKGDSKLRYQTHRGIDGAYGVITATVPLRWPSGTRTKHIV